MARGKAWQPVGVTRVLAWLLVVPIGAWVVMRLFGLERGFPLVPLVAFTPLVVVGSVAVIAVAALLRQPVAALVAAVLAILLVVLVAPRALGGPSEPDGPAGARLRVLSANMQFGTGSAEALVALARDVRADVLAVQELTPSLASELDASGLAELLPERVIEPQPRGTGIGLYARIPLTPGPITGRLRNPLAAATARPSGGPALELMAVHVTPPFRHQVAGWRADLRSVPRAQPDGRLRILAGDFNATLDHAELRDLLDSGYVDAAAEVGAGLRATWPDDRRLPPPVTIDHVIADERVGVREFSVHRIPGTDHRAVFAELLLPR
jgi:endonuclease/exonuclease/phosphatase (EEP) superfamily protein YafD